MITLSAGSAFCSRLRSEKDRFDLLSDCSVALHGSKSAEAFYLLSALVYCLQSSGHGLLDRASAVLAAKLPLNSITCIRHWTEQSVTWPIMLSCLLMREPEPQCCLILVFHGQLKKKKKLREWVVTSSLAMKLVLFHCCTFRVDVFLGASRHREDPVLD